MSRWGASVRSGHRGTSQVDGVVGMARNRGHRAQVTQKPDYLPVQAGLGGILDPQTGVVS